MRRCESQHYVHAGAIHQQARIRLREAVRKGASTRVVACPPDRLCFPTVRLDVKLLCASFFFFFVSLGLAGIDNHARLCLSEVAAWGAFLL